MISLARKSDTTISIQSRCLQKAMPIVFLLLALLPGLSAGGEAEDGQALRRTENKRSEDGMTKADFLFKEPIGFIGFRVGKFFPRAESDLFDMVTRELTLEKDDFQALDFVVDGGYSLVERLDLVFDLESSSSTKNSEFRYYVDEQGMPITQSTRFSQSLLTAGVKFLLAPRGLQVGRYAWLPSPIVPFVGCGGGILWYSFRQSGDFVDGTTLEIFQAKLESSGSVPAIYLGGGADIQLLRSAYLTLDLRYSWANHELDGDFVGFDPIDLSGLRLTAGVHWRF